MEPLNTKPVRMVQNFLLVWLDGSIDEENNDDCRNSITKLRQIVNTVNTFTAVDECIDFITDVKYEMIFMIISGPFSQTIVPIIQDIPQVSSVYIFRENKTTPVQWAKQWSKIKGVFTDVTPICEALKQAAYDCDKNLVPISIFKLPNDGPSNQNLDQLDQSFMYTQTLKEILLTITFEQKHINEFLTYCREQFVDNTFQLKNVDKFEQEYHLHQPIWWYTYGCFLYPMLNRALRMMEVDLIIKMGFFVKDLHNHIAARHSERYHEKKRYSSFTVYRGQGLSQTDFDQLMKAKGGLLSFNNFLSTSLDRSVSLAFAESNQDDPETIGVLFEITINPSIAPTVFSSIRDVSAYQTEEEILFSMHSVFRIGQIKQFDGNNRLWQVELALTSDNDPQLHDLTKYLSKEIIGLTGWNRLGSLMIRLGHFNKAEDLYEILLEKTTAPRERASIYHYLAQSMEHQGKYIDALRTYEKALEICQKTLPLNHRDLATSYGNIANVYDEMGEYSKALSYCEKAFEIQQKTLSPNHHSLTTSYNNIGLVYSNMGEYSKALSYYEKTLKIRQKTLPPNHPHLASSCNNIGLMYSKMDECSKALSYYEKAIEILQKTLPPTHPDLATSYNNVGSLYYNMGDYSKALSYYEKAIDIYQKILPPNHPHLATFYSNIGLVYDKMSDYPQALSYYEKAIDIDQKTLPPNHPHLATSYNNIGSLYHSMGEHSKALSFYEKAIEILQKTLSPNHPHLVTSYNNTGSVYFKMGEYSKALSCYEKALKIRQKTLPANHPDLATSYNSTGSVYYNMDEYSKAFLYYEKGLEILQKTLPPNHPDVATSYNNTGNVYFKMGEYSKALSCYEKALEIRQKTLPSNHPNLATSYNSTGSVYYNMGEYSKAFSYYEKGLEILQKTLPPNHRDLATSYNDIGFVYYKMGEYSKALSYCERAVNILQRSPPAYHPDLLTLRKNLEFIKQKCK